MASILTPKQIMLGNPANDAHQPDRPNELIPWMNYVQSLNEAGASVGLVKETKADLLADLEYADSVRADVILDPVAANNGVYAKSGVAGVGTWERKGDLPNSLIALSNDDEDPDDIEASSLLPAPLVAGKALFTLDFLATNTGAMTLKLGTVTKPIKTNVGADIPAGYVSPGMMAILLDTGADFRFLSYGDAAAIQVAAEVASVIALNAASAAEGFKTDAENAAAMALGFGMKGPWADATNYTLPSAVSRNGTIYILTNDHLSSAVSQPGTGVDWEDFWVAFIIGGVNLDGPEFTDIPTSPTAAPDSNSTLIATTEYVDTALAALPSGGGDGRDINYIKSGMQHVWQGQHEYLGINTATVRLGGMCVGALVNAGSCNFRRADDAPVAPSPYEQCLYSSEYVCTVTNASLPADGQVQLRYLRGMITPPSIN